MREYKVDEQIRTSYELEAVSVGHDLSRGTSEFTRVIPTNSPVTVERGEDGLPVDDSDRWLGLVDPGSDAGDDLPSADPATGQDSDARELAAVS